jgi:hypothetical protein
MNQDFPDFIDCHSTTDRTLYVDPKLLMTTQPGQDAES